MPRRYGFRDVEYTRRMLDHAWDKHRISVNEIKLAARDTERTILRAKGGRYILTGKGYDGRLVSLVAEKHGAMFRLRTARLANRREHKLYKER